MSAQSLFRPLFRQSIPTVLAGLLLAACAPTEDSGEPAISSPAQDFDTSLTVAEVMNLVLEPAADVLWDSGGWVLDAAGYEELYPTTDDGWAYVRAQAAVVRESGNLLALPGRALDDDAWLIYSQGLSDAGRLAMEAAAAQDEEAFFQAGAQIYSVCSACHQAYNPEILNRFVSGSSN